MNIGVFLIFLLINNLSFSSIITLPNPTGLYGVGSINVELFDPSRTQLRGSEKRRWMATIFYPTTKTKDVYPLMVILL